MEQRMEPPVARGLLAVAIRMATHRQKGDARPGDWLEARAIYGGPPRRGQVTQLIGDPGHRRYRVRWDEGHESIVYPSDGISIDARRAR